MVFNIHLDGGYGGHDLPDWDNLSPKIKNWILETGVCSFCNKKLSKSQPHCECDAFVLIQVSGYERKAFLEIYKNEIKRYRNKIRAERYRTLKNNAEGKHSQKDIKSIYDMQEGCCYYCLREITYNDIARKTFEVDHIIPLSQGGSNWPENIACTCKECNRLKSGSSTEFFWKYIKEKFGKELYYKARALAKKQQAIKKENRNLQ